MKRTLLCFAALALFLYGAGQAQAGILFNDYGPGYTYNTGTGWTVSGPTSAVGSEFDAANEFTPTMTGAVSSVDLGISLVSGTNSVTVDLMTDNAGMPGVILESYVFVSQMGPFGSQNAPLVATSVTNPVLVAGTNYWMVVFPGAANTWAAWNFNNQGATGTDEYSQNGGATWNNGGVQTLGAFEVFGGAGGPATPEPASLTLFGLGALGVGGYLLRRRKLAAV